MKKYKEVYINRRIAETEEMICKTENQNFEIIQSGNMEKRKKGMKKAFVIYRTQPKEPICELLEFQKETKIGSLFKE